MIPAHSCEFELNNSECDRIAICTVVLANITEPVVELTSVHQQKQMSSSWRIVFWACFDANLSSFPVLISKLRWVVRWVRGLCSTEYTIPSVSGASSPDRVITQEPQGSAAATGLPLSLRKFHYVQLQSVSDCCLASSREGIVLGLPTVRRWDPASSDSPELSKTTVMISLSLSVTAN